MISSEVASRTFYLPSRTGGEGHWVAVAHVAGGELTFCSCEGYRHRKTCWAVAEILKALQEEPTAV